jgi:hypothetical protein
MKVEILRSVMISGEPAKAGSILEVENSDAVTLIGLGKAVEYKEEVAPSCPPKKPPSKRTKT